MQRARLRGRIEAHLRVLATEIGARPPGSPANHRATAYVAGVFHDCGLEVRRLPFTTRWWEPGPGTLTSPTSMVDLLSNPYSRPCDIDAPVVRVGDLTELEALDTEAGRVLVLTGELSRQPVLPRAFPFLQLEEHRRLVEAIESARPAAVIAVSDHPEPIFEDPDLALASTSVPTAVGDELRTGDRIRLRLSGTVHDGEGDQVTARAGGAGRRLVLSAHLDTKATTPGAFDNAGGLAVVLALSEVGLDDLGAVEIVPFNGEDHFDACGEQAWLAATDLQQVIANVNVDGVGLRGQGTSLAVLSADAALETALADLVAKRPSWVLANPWFESDHAIFAMRGIPAVAVTSEDVHQLMGGLAHTPADTVEVVDLDVLVDVAEGLHTVLRDLEAHLTAAPPPPA
jgi:aminopeptidase YwaD